MATLPILRLTISRSFCNVITSLDNHTTIPVRITIEIKVDAPNRTRKSFSFRGLSILPELTGGAEGSRGSEEEVGELRRSNKVTDFFSFGDFFSDESMLMSYRRFNDSS